MSSLKSYHPTDAQREQYVEKLAYRINEVALALGIGRSSIYKEIAAGRLKAIKVAGRRLILKSDLEEYLAACREVK